MNCMVCVCVCVCVCVFEYVFSSTCKNVVYIAIANNVYILAFTLMLTLFRLEHSVCANGKLFTLENIVYGNANTAYIGAHC